MSTFRAVEIEWNDAFELSNSDWYSLKELKEKIPSNKKGELSSSLSWLIQETDDHILLAQTNQPESDERDDSLSGIILIPRGMVKAIHYMVRENDKRV